MANELFTEALRRGTVAHFLAAPEAFADLENPTVAEFNTANRNLIVPITCIDEEAFSFTVDGSDMDTRMTFCDGAGKSTPSKKNVSISIGLNRDKDRTANGNYNEALAWFLKPDRTFIWITRIGDVGVTPSTAFSVADERTYMARFKTDYPIDTMAPDAPALLTIEPKFDGYVRWNLAPVAS